MIQFDADIEPATSYDPAQLPGQLAGWLSPLRVRHKGVLSHPSWFLSEPLGRFGKRSSAPQGAAVRSADFHCARAEAFICLWVVYERSEVVILTIFIFRSEIRSEKVKTTGEERRGGVGDS